MSKVADRNQRQLLDLIKVPGNEFCADCKGRNPRWAAWDHGIFICLQCAGLHRKMGTHISKVKSLTMDTWSREQVDNMKSVGNIRSNAYLNPDESLNPPPTSTEDADHGSHLEKFIRNKYEHRIFAVSSTRSKTSEIESNVTSATVPGRSSEASGSFPPPSTRLLGDSIASVSSTTNEHSKKNVRFRSNSLPIPDDMPVRPPSSILLGSRTPPPKGILRPRSVSALEAGSDHFRTPPKIPVEWPDEEEEPPEHAGFSNAIIGRIEPQKTGSAWGLPSRQLPEGSDTWTGNDQQTSILDLMTSSMTPLAVQQTSFQPNLLTPQATGSTNAFLQAHNRVLHSGTPPVETSPDHGLVGFMPANSRYNAVPTSAPTHFNSYRANTASPNPFYSVNRMVDPQKTTNLPTMLRNFSPNNPTLTPQQTGLGNPAQLGILNGQHSSIDDFYRSITPQRTGSATQFGQVAYGGQNASASVPQLPPQTPIWEGLGVLEGSVRLENGTRGISSNATQAIEARGESAAAPNSLSFDQIYMTQSEQDSPFLSESFPTSGASQRPATSSVPQPRRAFVPSSQFGRQEFGDGSSSGNPYGVSPSFQSQDNVERNMDFSKNSQSLGGTKPTSFISSYSGPSTPAGNGLFDLKSTSNAVHYNNSTELQHQQRSNTVSQSYGHAPTNISIASNPFTINNVANFAMGSMGTALPTLKDLGTTSYNRSNDPFAIETGQSYQYTTGTPTYEHLNKQTLPLQQSQNTHHPNYPNFTNNHCQPPPSWGHPGASASSYNNMQFPQTPAVQQSLAHQQDQAYSHNYWR